MVPARRDLAGAKSSLMAKQTGEGRLRSWNLGWALGPTSLTAERSAAPGGSRQAAEGKPAAGAVLAFPLEESGKSLPLAFPCPTGLPDQPGARSVLLPLPGSAPRPPGPGFRTARKPRHRRAAECAARPRAAGLPAAAQCPRSNGLVSPGWGLEARSRRGTSTGSPRCQPLTASSCFRFTSSASSRRVSGICGGAALLCIAMLG